MFNTEKNIIKAFITSLVIFLIAIFIPTLHLHASTITPIFDNKNLNNEIAVKAMRTKDHLAVFTIEISNTIGKVKHNYAHIAKENNNSRYEWGKKILDPNLGLPIIITHNNEKVIIIGTDKELQNVYVISENIDDFFNENGASTESTKIKENFSAFDFKKKNKLDNISKSITSFSKNASSDVQYFWSNDDSLLNIWSKNNNELIVLDVNTFNVNKYNLPLNINNEAKSNKVTNQGLSYNNGVYYLTFDIDNSITPVSYGISHKSFYSYNGSNWIENPFLNQFGEYEIFLESYKLGSSLYQSTVNIDFTSFSSNTNVWKISDPFTPWEKTNIKIPGESYIIGLNKIGNLYNLITMSPNHAHDQYDIRYFVTKDMENFDYYSEAPEIAETVNPQYKAIFYLNVRENSSNTAYIEKHSVYKLNEKNQKSQNHKFALLKVE